MEPDQSVRALPQTPAIYLLKCKVNGKQYVGQAGNLRSRWYWHRNAACGAIDGSYDQRTAIARAMRKHGVENFTLTILEQCNRDVLNEREVLWIAALGSLVPNGYNLTLGGVPARRADEVGARISVANKGRVKTPEWRAKLSASHKGKKLSAEHRQKISEVQRGRKQSAETNAKRSASLIGRKLGPYSAERCAAIKAGMTDAGRERTRAGNRLRLALKRASQLAVSYGLVG